MNSLIQDLGAHPETEASVSIVVNLMGPLVITGNLRSPHEIRKFIEGFN